MRRIPTSAFLVFTAVVLAIGNFDWTAGFVAGLAAAEVSRAGVAWWARR